MTATAPGEQSIVSPSRLFHSENADTTTQDYHATITTNAAPSTAMGVVRSVSQWWTASFDGSARQAHDRFSVGFGETFVDFEVIDRSGDGAMTWLVTECNLRPRPAPKPALP